MTAFQKVRLQMLYTFNFHLSSHSIRGMRVLNLQANLSKGEQQSTLLIPVFIFASLTFPQNFPFNHLLTLHSPNIAK